MCLAFTCSHHSSPASCLLWAMQKPGSTPACPFTSRPLVRARPRGKATSCHPRAQSEHSAPLGVCRRGLAGPLALPLGTMCRVSLRHPVPFTGRIHGYVAGRWSWELRAAQQTGALSSLGAHLPGPLGLLFSLSMGWGPGRARGPLAPAPAAPVCAGPSLPARSTPPCTPAAPPAEPGLLTHTLSKSWQAGRGSYARGHAFARFPGRQRHVLSGKECGSTKVRDTFRVSPGEAGRETEAALPSMSWGLGPRAGSSASGYGNARQCPFVPPGGFCFSRERFHHSLAHSFVHSFIRWVQDGNLPGQLWAEGWSRGGTEPRDCVGLHSGYVGTALLLALQTGAQGPGASASCAFWGLRTCFP